GSSLDVNRVADGWDLAGFRIGLAVSTPHHLVNLLLTLTVLGRDLDDLDAIKIAAVGVFNGVHDKRRSGCARRCCEVASHGYTAIVSGLPPVSVLCHVLGIIPTGKHADLDPSA